MTYYAELDASKRVLRVVVCDTVEWLQSRLGGTWTLPGPTTAQVQGAGPGMYDSEDVAPRRFVPQWVQPVGSEDAYATGMWVWHAGKVWENLTPANVWEPGVYGWTEVTA